MTKPFRVGQAVVTDPLEKGGGYVLVAASPSVTAEERQYLEDFPDAGDALHVEKQPGRYYSFLRLPGGRWALTQRFTSGKRRVSFNRIVVHTVVLSEEVLDAFAFEPYLFVDQPYLRRPNSNNLIKLTDLENEAGGRDLHLLTDLEAIPPRDPRGTRARYWRDRCNKLAGIRSRVWLESQFAYTFTALASQNGVLTAFDGESADLLLLAWSALPLNERRSLSWTTHLSPSIPGFHLALAPKEVIETEPLTGPWPWARRSETLKHATTQQMGELADWLCHQDDPIPGLDEGYLEHKIQVTIPGKNSLPLWLKWIGGNRDLLEKPTTLEDFERLLSGLHPGHPLPPWLAERHSEILRLIKHLCRIPEAQARVLQILKELNLTSRILGATSLERFVALPSVTLDETREITKIAIDAGQPETETREIYTSKFESIDKTDRARITDAERIHFALDCGLHDFARVRECATILLETKGGLTTALALFKDSAPAARQLALELLRQGTEKQDAETIFRDLIKSWLNAEQAIEHHIADPNLVQTVTLVVERLWRVASEDLAPTILGWPSQSTSPVLTQLPEWSRRDPARLKLFLTPEMVTHLARPVPEISGLACQFAAAGISETQWAPFAASEVDALSRDPKTTAAIDDLISLLEKQIQHSDSRRAVAKVLLNNLVGNVPRLGAGHRRLVEQLVPELVSDAPKILAAWKPHFEKLAEERNPWLSTFERLSPPGSHFEDAVRRARNNVRLRTSSPIDLAATLPSCEWSEPNANLVEILDSLATPQQRLETIGTLLGSSRILPSIKRSIEQHHLTPALLEVGSKVRSSDVSPVATDASLFYSRMLFQAGRACQLEIKKVFDILCTLAKQKHFWQIGVLLWGADLAYDEIVDRLRRMKPGLLDELAKRRELSYLRLNRHKF